MSDFSLLLKALNTVPIIIIIIIIITTTVIIIIIIITVVVVVVVVVIIIALNSVQLIRTLFVPHREHYNFHP